MARKGKEEKPINLSKESEKALLEEITPEFIDEYKAMITDYKDNPDSYPVIAEYGIKQSYITYLSGKDNKYEYIESINGAEVKPDINAEIKCEVFKEVYPDGKENLLGYSIELNSDVYLGDIFSTTPYGIIKKNRTGVGATSLEINSNRNSIIVVPTKALAYKKALKGVNKQTGESKYLYVGSKIKDAHTFPTLEEYINDERIEFKKVIVVADSLGKVITAIGNNVYKDYFLMVDEIDIYQSDGIFRPALEKVMDYYFEFDHTKRCLVSATIRKFSDSLITKEPTININYTKPQPRQLSLIHSNNTDAVVKEKIEWLFDNKPDEKIVIAYNKVMFMRQIIQNLKPECQKECAILCSEASEEYAGAFYSDFEEEQLPKRIVFMTNPFFAGIDIPERFHLISVSNAEFIYTLLSPDRLQQIAGRCRDKEGLFSETILYNTRPYEGKLKPEPYKEYLLQFADDIIDCMNHATEIKRKYSQYNIIDDAFLDVKKDIVKRTERYYYKDTKMTIIRQSVVTGEYLPAYFNIDSPYDTLKLHISLYTNPEKLIDALKEDNEIIDFQVQDIEYTQEQLLNNKIIEEEYDMINEKGIDKVIDGILALKAFGRLNDYTLGKLVMSSTRKSKQYAEAFQKLYKYIPTEKLISDLRENYAHKTMLRTYNNSVILWALPDDNLFKIDMRAKFPEGLTMPTEKMIKKVKAVYSHHFNITLKDNVAIQVLNEFIETDKGHSRSLERTIKSHNQFNLPDEPLIKIPIDENIKDLLMFRGE